MKQEIPQPTPQDIREAFAPKALPAADGSPALAGLIERLTLAADNYERCAKSLPRFWQWDVRDECRHKAAGIREAITMARQCQESI